MNETLLIQPQTNLMKRLTVINGNVDDDKMDPSIWVAQIVDIKRILSDELYERILSDFDNDTLSGDYLFIYDEFVAPMLVFYSTADFIKKNSFMVAQGGNFKHKPDNAEAVDAKDVDALVKYYRELGAAFEIKFYEYMKDKNIPEYKRYNVDVETFKFNWYFK